MLAVAGCSSSGPKPTPESEGKRLFDQTNGATSNSQDFWTIGLKPFAGNDAAQLAQDELSRLVRLPGLDEAFILDRGQRVIVCIGRQPSPNTREAIALLDRVRKTRVEGSRPFARAFYIPPEGKAQSDLDLRSVPSKFGEDAVYTLQVGAYGRADGRAPTQRDIEEAREKAVEAVEELRRQGELAFYYHGPSMSMVTVGVFSHSDIDPVFSFGLRSLMERFPHNLLNGQGVNQTVTMSDGTRQQILQESFPVLIPEN
ncbi:MAG: hypothetical protein Phyf2KO_23770 [Phycisphaerales bacterium]